MSPHVRVDILFSLEDTNSKHHVHRQPSFTLTEDARHNGERLLASQVRETLSKTGDAVVIIFHGGGTWLDRILQSDALKEVGIKRYPGWLSNGYLSKMTQEGSRIKIPSVPPSAGRTNPDLAFILEFYGKKAGIHRGCSHKLDFLPSAKVLHSHKHDIVHSTRVGCWIQSKRKAQKDDPSKPIILLFFQSDNNHRCDYTPVLFDRYDQADNHRFGRLLHNPDFLYWDLHQAFEDWEGVVAHLHHHYKQTNEKVENAKHRVSRLGHLANEIQGQSEDVIFIQRELHIAKKAAKQMLVLNEANPTHPGREEERVLRLSDYLRDLNNEHEILELTTNMLVDQLKRLLDLEFNLTAYWTSISANRTNERVRIVTIFAAVFAPLGVASAIFGMNGVNIDAKWFILVGILVAAISLLCFMLVDNWPPYTRKE